MARSFALLVAPARFALRRSRASLPSTVGIVLALGLAGAVIGWSSVAAADANEQSLRVRLRELPPADRALTVTYFTLPHEGDRRDATVSAALRGFRDVAAPPRAIRISHSIETNRPLGTRLVTAEARDVHVTRGRLPRPCRARVCDLLALGRTRLGARIALGNGIVGIVAGSGRLATPVDASQLGGRPLLVASFDAPLSTLVDAHGSTTIYRAELDPARMRAYELPRLTERIRREVIRLERGDPAVDARAPLALLDRVAARGDVARSRLLLVAGEAAALVIAFAAFIAATRRRDAELAADQLSTLGATRAQVLAAQIVEALVAGVAGLILAVAAVWIGARIVAGSHGYAAGFGSAALPVGTVLAMGAAELVAAGLIVRAARAQPRARGFGALEVGALAALAIVSWQTASTGALDPGRVAGSDSPVVLAVPALAFFAAGILLLRALPVVLRSAERAARRAPFGLRLSLLTAARSPRQAAASTTFLAIVLGAALFSLGYRATLERQLSDEASFRAGARWRVAESARSNLPSVAPLTRYRRATREPATPVLRLDGAVTTTATRSGQMQVTVLALPARRLTSVLGWRRDLARSTPSEVAAAIRPANVALHGPTLGTQVTALRAFARAETDYPRDVVLHFLRPGQAFAELTIGRVSRRRWERFHVAVPPSLRRAQLVAVEFRPTFVPLSFKYDPKGFVDLGTLEQNEGGTWRPLPSLGRWTPTVAATGTAGILTAATFAGAPVRTGIHFELAGTLQPLIHPKLGLPQPLPGFEVGTVRAFASADVAAAAVDGLLTVDVAGRRLAVRVVGTGRRFPTVVDRPGSFLVLDYETLFAALNGDRPGIAPPNEAWFFAGPPRDFARAVSGPPFRGATTVGLDTLRSRLSTDPLAAGTRDVLALAAIAAALLAFAGLVLGARSALAAERLMLAEYEALGVTPRTLRRTAQIRLVLLAAVGVVAGVAGGALSVRLVAAFVEVTGTATRPILSIAPVHDVPHAALLVVTVAVAATGAAVLVANRALRAPAARRLRA